MFTGTAFYKQSYLIGLNDNRFKPAPMVNQSDLPFRILVSKYGATLVYTQMLLPNRLLNDQQYFEHHQRDLTLAVDNCDCPVVVQLCGNNVESIVQSGRKLEGYCQGIDLNLGCPLEAARDDHFGAYLLHQNDWQLVQNIVSGMKRSFVVPVSAKLRLCQPARKTLDLAQRLEACGASWITLHARTVSARRRRQGAANLSEVKRLKDNMRLPIISNGNVRFYGDIWDNLDYTGADGVMVGETLLGNPCLFTNAVPDPVDVSLEYLEICQRYPETATLSTIKTHIRHFVEYQWRRPWFQKFRAALGPTKTLEEIENLLRTKVERWRGLPPRCSHSDTDGNDVDENETEGEFGGDLMHFSG